MMQVPSSNYSIPSSQQREKTTRRVVRWLDGFFDKACCAAAPYNVGDEVLDDASIAYSEGEEENQARVDQDRHVQQLLSSSRPRGGLTRRQQQFPSALFDAAEDSMKWVYARQDDNSNSMDEVVRRQASPRDHREGSRRRHNQHHHHKQSPPRSPASDATATTVLTGSTTSSRTTELRSGGRGFSKSPRYICSNGKHNMADKTSFQERAHSTGTMPRIEAWEDDDDILRIQRAHSIQSSSARAGGNDYNNRRPREVLVPRDWTDEQEELRRTNSDTIYKLPFQAVVSKEY